MATVIGIDEAGYGPNLGPLVIGFSAWQVPTVETNLYDLLADAVSLVPRTDRLAICDSKKTGKGISGLETAVFASLTAMQKKLPTGWEDLNRIRIELPETLPTESAGQSGFDWAEDDDPPGDLLTDQDEWSCQRIPVGLPMECNQDESVRLGNRLRETAGSNGAALIGLGVVLVYPVRFNRMLEQHGNKSRLLGAATMHVTRHALGLAGAAEPVRVICDRQGGRQRYSPLLRATFENHDIMKLSESPECSTYRVVGAPTNNNPSRREFEIGFHVGGESHLPVALASMAAKYVRELAMIQWNRYWHTRIDGIHPTAGYPVDAIRFRNDLRRHITEQEMPDHLFWRAK